MDEAFARELDAIDWFHSCGQPLAAGLPFAASPVGSRPEAIRRCSDPSWEDTTLEARNQLTEFLHTHHRDAFRDWNTITVAATVHAIDPLKDRVWRPFAERSGFGKVLVDCVSWDVLAAIMEHEYRDCPRRPDFFLQLVRVYRAGHLPCGWCGVWPAGRLLVW